MTRTTMHRLCFAVVNFALLLALALPSSGEKPARDEAGDLYFSANALYNRGLYELSAGEYRGFLKQHPQHEKAKRARLGLALSLYGMGAYEEAVPLFKQIERDLQGTEADEVTVLCGQSLLQLGRYAEAEEVFDRAVRNSSEKRHKQYALSGLTEALFRQEKWSDGNLQE